MEIGQKMLATDHYESYHNEPVTIVGFDTNYFGAEIVEVRLESGRETIFYPSELRNNK